MSSPVRALMVYCTCPNADSAAQLAAAAVSAGHAACVNRIEGVHSVFEWDGAVQTEQEVLLVAKTTPAAYTALETLWLKLHPYELPEIVAVPIAYGSEPYLAWIESCVCSS